MTKCIVHPNAPHGFDRNASHNKGEYVCDCEGWEPMPPEQIIQELVDKLCKDNNKESITLSDNSTWEASWVKDSIYGW